MWVQEGYLEYQQMPDNDPHQYEFLGLCRDQQVGSHRVSAQSQPKVFQSLPTPVCRDCEEGEEES